MRNSWPALWLALALGMPLSTLTGQETQKPEKPGFAGSEACAACHEDLAKAFSRTRHQAIEKEKKRGWEGRACESCHGPGVKHAESADAALIINPAKLRASDENSRCLSCHVNQNAPTGRIVTGHANGQVSCSTCHNIHSKQGESLHARQKRQTDLCGGCHQSAVAAFERPHAHPVSQGVMGCADCHNPHNPASDATKRSAFGNEPSCLTCHSSLRGPFVYEHAPVRLEGCGSCHVPHGSPNPKLLVRNEVRTLCLECHADVGAVRGTAAGGVPPAFHDLRSSRFQSCTTCHRKIHGSHVDRSLQR